MTTPPDDTFLIETPEQLRLVGDPLRQRLLTAFAQSPSTVKAVAAALGEPLTKLYHHVDQLEAAGLIRVVGEEKRRGTVQRTFTAAARRFVVGPGALGAAGAGKSGRAAVARAAFEELLSRGLSEDEDAPRLRLMRATARLTPEGIERLEAALGPLLRAHEDPEGEEVEYLVVAAPRPRTSS